MFGTFPDYDGDGQCDPGGVSVLNQHVPGVFEGDLVTLSMSSWTPAFDSIVGTDNSSVLQKIEFLGSDSAAHSTSWPASYSDGAGAFNNDVLLVEIRDGPAGTRFASCVRLFSPTVPAVPFELTH